MSFIIYPPCQGGTGEGGGGGGVIEAPVKSVNGKTGHVFLTHRDINAVRNLQASVGGIQAGSMRELPRTPEQGTIFISTDKVPNTMYFYNRNKWEKLSGDSDKEIEAIGVTFNNSKGYTKAKNVQDALDEAFYQIKVNDSKTLKELDNLDRKIGLIEKSDGKIRLTEFDRLGFLEDKLTKTLKVENNLLTVKGIDGMMSTVRELNSLQGIKGNVQEQIDKLANVSSLASVVDTHKDLMSIDLDTVNVNDLIIVREDETKDNNSTMYILDNKKNWLYIGAYDLEVEIRDFEIDPIDLTKEVKGVLSEKNIDKILVRREELEEIKENINIKTTDDLPEGSTNKYYTKERVDKDINLNRKVMDSYENMHNHYNKETIDELGETVDGALTFRGRVIGDFDGELPPVVDADGRVKVSANDVLGYLGTKVDNRTILSKNNKLEARSLVGMLAEIEEINHLIGVRENIQEQLDNQDSKIKVDRYDTAGYLGQKIDRDTIVVKNGKLLANRLNGQTVSIGEINYTKGLKGNIQEQIDNLSKVGSFTNIVDNFSDLSKIKNPTNGDLVMVSNDETHDDKTTFYMYDNGEWVYGGDFHIELRNFETDPIKLGTEVAGVLREDKIDSRIARKTDLEDIRVKNTNDVPEGSRNKYYTDSRVSQNNDVKANTNARHRHNNVEVLESLSESQGRLMYNGEEIKSQGEITWEEF